LSSAQAVFTGIQDLGIDTCALFRELEDEGIRKFSQSFDALLGALAKKEKAVKVP
jgi:transaldolase